MSFLYKKLLLIFVAILSFGALNAQMSGTYTIGSSGNYPDFTEALNAVAQQGQSGDILFLVEEGIYNNTLSISLEPYIYGISFQPDPSNTQDIIVQSSDTAVMTIRMAKNIAFENIHFRNTSSIGSQKANVILITPEGMQLVDSVLFRNCVFTGYDHIQYGTPQTPDKELVKGTEMLSGYASENVSFENCTFDKGTTAFSFSAVNFNPAARLKLSNNVFTNFLDTAINIKNYSEIQIEQNTITAGPDSVSTVIEIRGGDNIAINQNQISGILSQEDYYACKAVYLYFSNNITISGNTIELTNYPGAEPAPGSAIMLEYTGGLQLIEKNDIKLTTEDLTAVNVMYPYDQVLVKNNMIIVSSADMYPNSRGVSLGGGESSVLLYNNSINMQGNANALYIDNYMGMGNILVKNNIFANDGMEATFWLEGVLDGLSSDNNIFYTTSEVLIFLGGVKDVFYDLQGWQSFSGMDFASYFEDPQFMDPANNLHLSQYNPAESRGIPLAEVQFDFDGEIRNPDTPDIGADEGNFIVGTLTANAGPDQETCGDVFFMEASEPAAGTEGLWTVLSGDAYIHNVSDPNTQVSNVQAGGATVLRWSVSDGQETAHDDVSLTNLQPYVDAGDDITLYLDDLAAVFPDVALEGNTPDGLNFGFWTIVSTPGGIGVSNTLNNLLNVSGISPGIHTLRWTITDGQCFNYDDLSIIAGYSFVANPPVKTPLDWTDPTHWDLGQVPGSSDSATVYDCIANVDGVAAEVDQLVVGSGTEFNIFGTSKAAGSMTARGLYIEQSAVKFGDVKGDAIVNLTGNSELNVGAGYLKGNRSTENSGIVVGSGGELNVHNSGAKGKEAKSTANLNIGSGGGLYIEQTAVKSSASVTIGSGGGLYIEQTAVKDKSRTSANPGIHIGAGGGLYIEQTAVKDKSAGQVVLGAGRGIYIEQSAVKTNGGLVVSGGGLYIEQTAVKSSGSQNGINIGSGGGLYIEQTAVKSPATVSAPYINVTDGQIIVGADAKSKVAGGNLSFRGLYIEQTAVKGFPSDTALIINEGASIYLDTSYTNGPAYFELAPGTVVSALEGSEIIADNGNEAFTAIIHHGASFIDKSTGDAIWGRYKYQFPASQTDAFGAPFEMYSPDELILSPAILSWDEFAAEWISAGGMSFSAIQGFAVRYETGSPINQNLSGVFNKAYQSVSVFNSGVAELSGWNLASNPYPSAIDAATFEFGSYISPYIYVYDGEFKTFKVYSPNGMSLNNGSQYIPAGEAFVIYTSADTEFFMDSGSQLHYMGNPVAGKTSPEQSLKLKVSGDNAQDELALHFNELASDDFDNGLDAYKYPNFEQTSVNFFSKTAVSDEHSYAVNAMPLTVSTRSIPIFFSSAVSGTYTLDMTEITLLDDNVDVYLQDIFNPTLNQNLRDNSSYTFTHAYTNTPYRFNIIVGQMTTDVPDEKPESVLVYAVDDQVFLNSTVDGQFEVKLYDISGRLLMMKEFYGEGMHQFDTELSSGIYIVQIKDGSQLGRTKVFIGK